jgi:hypothetical protein
MTQQVDDGWQTIEIPSGKFYGWGNKVGQSVIGRVISYDATGGTDYDGVACPLLEIELEQRTDSFTKGERTVFEAGEIVRMNCGQAHLKTGVRVADLAAGDKVRIALVDLQKSGRGSPLKKFDIAVKRTTLPETPIGDGSLQGDPEPIDEDPMF